jgi:uncharacterized RDD family membrane protein YckC
MSMTEATSEGVEPLVVDPYEIGWYIESADEDTYGPASRKTVRQFLENGTITPNTLVRHCTQPEARPAADQPALKEQPGPVARESGGDYGGLYDADQDAGPAQFAKGPAVGDRLAEAWPRKWRDQVALAEGSAPCAWHKQPAVLVCVRCHAPYCNKCRTKPFKKQFFLCRRCQTGLHNRRFSALLVDTGLLVYVPLIITMVVLIAVGVSPDQMPLITNIVQVGTICLLLVRDSLFGGAGIGKRMVGLRVVQSKDGRSPLTYGQGVVRWLSQFIPFFNLADAIVPYSDPLFRRFGDRWAGTRVIDNERKLAKERAKTTRRLLRKGVQPSRNVGMTMEELARLT